MGMKVAKFSQPSTLSQSTTSKRRPVSNDQIANNEVEIEFFNRTKNVVNVWVEPACFCLDLDANTEYKLVARDRFFRLEIDHNAHLIFYLQHSFGFKLFKRAAVIQPVNPNDWILDFDCSDIN